MMNLRRMVAAAVMVAALGGCATAYQSKGYTGGFSETLLGPDTFRIRFAGNGFTSAERASDFALLRAAERSLDQGCGYFGIMNEVDGASLGSMTTTTAGWGGHRAWGFSTTTPIVKPNTSLLVKCARVPLPGVDLYDAHFIAQSIRAKYRLGPRQVPGSAVAALPQAPISVAETARVSPGSASTVARRPEPQAGPARDITPLRGEYPHSPLASISQVLPVASAPMRPSAARDAVEPSVSGLRAYTQMVSAAQQVATQIGCGTITLTGAATFQAHCESYDVQIRCQGDSCRPMHAIIRPELSSSAD